MPKQYTFRTTKDTHWLETILDGKDRDERSGFIRDMIALGIRASGHPLSMKKEVTRITSHEMRNTSHVDLHMPATPTVVEPIIQVMDEKVDDVDLDSKLDSLYE